MLLVRVVLLVNIHNSQVVEIFASTLEYKLLDRDPPLE